MNAIVFIALFILGSGVSAPHPPLHSLPSTCAEILSLTADQTATLEVPEPAGPHSHTVGRFADAELAEQRDMAIRAARAKIEECRAVQKELD